MAIPLSKQKLSADYGVTLSRGAAPQLADGTKVGGTTLTAAKFTAYDAALAGVVPVASAVYDAVTDFTNGAATVANEVRGVTVDITNANTALTLTLPTGANNLGDVLTLTVALDGANPGTLAVVCGGGVTLSGVLNGQYTFHCTGTGVWKPLARNNVGLGKITYDAVGDFTAGAATVPDMYGCAVVDITNAKTALTLTLPTGLSNLGRFMTVFVALDGATPGTLDVKLSSTVTIPSVSNGIYMLHCVDVDADGAVWQAIGQEKVIQDLYGVNIMTVSNVTSTYTAYTIPDRVNTFVLNDQNTVEGDKVAAIITLPEGAANVGNTIRIAVYLGDDAQKHTLNLVLGAESGTLINVPNGIYMFRCHTTGEWTRDITAQCGGLTDFGPGAVVTGDISSYNETAFKALLTACAKAGIIADTTTT